MKPSLNQRITHGAAWMVLFKAVDRSLGLISTLILVRILAPADFGLVAMAMSVIAMAELLSAFGFDIALVQRQRLSDEHYHSAWTCNVLLGLAIGLTLILAAGPVAAFYNQPGLYSVVCVLAMGPTLGGLENIGVVAFRKDLNFRKEFLFLASKKLIAFSITIPLAYWLESYWALVAGMVASRVAGVALSYSLHPFRPRLCLTHAADLFGFSKWLLFNNATIFVRERMTDFALGRLMGPRSLGLFSVANEFSNLTMTELAAPLNRVLLPAFARVQQDRAALIEAFNASISVLALIALPAAIGIAAVAPYLVPVVLGGKWLDAVPLMEILAMAGGIATFQSPICSILISYGRPDLVLRGHVSYIAIAMIALALLVPRMGAVGAAYSVLVGTVLSTPVFLWMLSRKLGVPARVFLIQTVRPLLASAVMLAIVRSVLPPYLPGLPADQGFGFLLGGIALGVVAYVPTVAALWLLVGRPAGGERIILDAIVKRIRRRNV